MMATAFHEGRKNGSHFERSGFRFPILRDSIPTAGTLLHHKNSDCIFLESTIEIFYFYVFNLIKA
jgi:hypothetical protein